MRSAPPFRAYQGGRTGCDARCANYAFFACHIGQATMVRVAGWEGQARGGLQEY